MSDIAHEDRAAPAALASIVIPTYNGAARVPAVLEALARQDTADGSFEVVIVDNASTDAIAELANSDPSVCALRKRRVECRLVREERRGLLHARIRGVLEARGDAVCFLDDDTIPDHDYVRRGIDALPDPSVGLLVSSISPSFEAVPPPSVKRREWLFAATYRLGASVIDLGAVATLAPTIGAGMWVRRDAFLRSVPWRTPELMLADRTGGQLTSGGDIEIGYMIGKAGLKRFYLPQLRLTHLIGRNRLGTAYVCRLIMGITRSELTLQHRYVRAYGAWARLKACLALTGAALAAPVVLLQRNDGAREALFILATRIARVEGPYASRPVMKGLDTPPGI
jgi:glycosyltransferase involved in cell wall biosynthesis